MESAFGIDAATALILTGLVMGGVELIKRAFAKDWKAVVTIVVSAAIGGIAGTAMGAETMQGVAFGLAASGYVALVQNIGSKSNAAPNE